MAMASPSPSPPRQALAGLALAGLVVAVVVAPVAEAVLGECEVDIRCVQACGQTCLQTCGLDLAEPATRAAVQTCLGHADQQQCSAGASTDAECFLGCQAQCYTDNSLLGSDYDEAGQVVEADPADGAGGETDSCREECGMLCQHLLMPAVTTTEDGASAEEEGTQFGPAEVDECLKLCTTSECLAADERYQFDLETHQVEPVRDSSRPAVAADVPAWDRHETPERMALLEAMGREDSPEAQKYREFMLHISTHFVDGGMDTLESEMLEIIEEMGLGGASEEEMMELLQSMMNMQMSMGDEYGADYGGGYGEPFEMEDEFEEAA